MKNCCRCSCSSSCAFALFRDYFGGPCILVGIKHCPKVSKCYGDDLSQNGTISDEGRDGAAKRALILRGVAPPGRLHLGQIHSLLG